MASPWILELIQAELSRSVKIGENETTIRSLFVDAWREGGYDAIRTIREVLAFPELTNPRLMRRIVDRIQLLTRANLIAEDKRLGERGYGREEFEAVVI